MFLSWDEVRERKWLAYPSYGRAIHRTPPFVLHERLYYLGAVEWAASAMEMSAISARNVVLLAHHRWHGQKAKIDQEDLHVRLRSELRLSVMDTQCRGLSALSISDVSPDTASAEPAQSAGTLQVEAEDDADVFGALSELPIEISERRPTCSRCHRPQKVCLCPFLPVLPLEVSTTVYIVQHPAEESRVLRTVPLLAACLSPEKCKVFIGRRFTEDRYPELAAVCQDPRTLILYPGSEAENLEDLDVDFTATPHNIIIIDGTWSQAKDMFHRNALFRLPKQVQLNSLVSSQYVIRTQPTNMCLSTLECAAVTLSIMEKNKDIEELLLRPLQALCSFQLQHGAQVHHSKEHQLKNGLYHKPMPKNKRKIKRMERLVSNQNV
ncbi:hypothetical protein GJAV_G00047600 [Gymnothorax javanicus]|nr:hypothetical protein GJAV_G00047600 [Gymnothorax javanicus]